MKNKKFNMMDVEKFNELHQEEGLSLREIALKNNTTHGVIRNS